MRWMLVGPGDRSVPMMKINFYATLRDLVGGASLEVELEPGTTAQGLIDLVVTDHPSLKTELLDEDGQLHSYLKMFINGREVVYLEKQFQHVLAPTDIVDVFPPVGGG